jgi:hypothetical protein
MYRRVNQALSRPSEQRTPECRARLTGLNNLTRILLFNGMFRWLSLKPCTLNELPSIFRTQRRIQSLPSHSPSFPHSLFSILLDLLRDSLTLVDLFLNAQHIR